MDKKKDFVKAVRRVARAKVDDEINALIERTNGSYSYVDALCFDFSTRTASRVMDPDSKDFDRAVSMQATTLACAIDDGALDKDYIYNSCLNLEIEDLFRG